MRIPLLTLCLTGFLSFVALSVHAQSEGGVEGGVDVEDRESCESVTGLLLKGGSASDVVRGLRLKGLRLVEATVYAMVCGGEANRTAIARAGIEMSENLAQAQSVAYALLATAGETGPVAETVRLAMDDFARLMGQPEVYQDKFTPLGSGVSPAA